MHVLVRHETKRKAKKKTQKHSLLLLNHSIEWMRCVDMYGDINTVSFANTEMSCLLVIDTMQYVTTEVKVH